MDIYSYSNSSVTLWATGSKRGMVSRLLECTTPFFWTLGESEGAREAERMQEKREGEKRKRYRRGGCKLFEKKGVKEGKEGEVRLTGTEGHFGSPV